MSGISSRCRCLVRRETPHAQHHDTLWAWHGRGLPSGRAKRLCSSAPHGSLLPHCPVPYTSANQTRRPTASSFLGGKRFPASRISSSVDGRTPAGIDDETTTNYLN